MDRLPIKYLQQVLQLVDSHKLTQLSLPGGFSVIKQHIPAVNPAAVGGPSPVLSEPTTIEELDADIKAGMKPFGA